MSSSDHKNIDLLQGSLSHKKDVNEEAEPAARLEYTAPQNGKKEEKKKPGWFSRWRKKSSTRADAPAADEASLPDDKAGPPASPADKSVLGASPANAGSRPANAGSRPANAGSRPANAGPPSFLNKTGLKPEKINKTPLPPVENLAGARTGLGVNLLSKEYAERLRAVNRKSFFVWSVVVTCLLVGLIALSIKLFSLQQNRSAGVLGRQNENLSKQIESYDQLAQEDKLLSAKTGAVEALLESHAFWPSFLEALEAVTIPEVTYLNITASAGGQVAINGLATDYTAVGRQLNLLEKGVPWIKKASITGASLSTVTGSDAKSAAFDLNLVVDPKIFAPE